MSFDGEVVYSPASETMVASENVESVDFMDRYQRPLIRPGKRWLITLLIWLATLAIARADGGFRTVTGPCGFVFPRDHGAHPDFRTEWWYYTGHLAGIDGRRFGFQLTFFRYRLAPPGQRENWPEPASAWRADQVYMAHLALTDVAGKRHLSAEKTARDAAGLAGTVFDGEKVTMHLGSWSARISDKSHRLEAGSENFVLHLDLNPLKPPTAHGEDGYSRKGTEAGRASCYYSMTRLDANGRITVEGRTHEVTGLAWMDHEYSTAPLEPGLSGWDWFSLQLGDGWDLMAFFLRQPDGTRHPASSGTLVAPDGRATHLSGDAFRLEVTRRWQSRSTGGRYPAGWRFEVPAADLVLDIAPVIEDQEMRMERSTGVTYWEGLVDAAGSRAGRPVKGQGYVELTGYAGPFEAPL